MFKERVLKRVSMQIVILFVNAILTQMIDGVFKKVS